MRIPGITPARLSSSGLNLLNSKTTLIHEFKRRTSASHPFSMDLVDYGFEVIPADTPPAANKSAKVPRKETQSPNVARAGALAPRDANAASRANVKAVKMGHFSTPVTFTGGENPFVPKNPAVSKQAAPSPKAKAPISGAKSKKRKIAADEPDIEAIMFPDDAPEIDDYDPRLNCLGDKGYTCQMVRKKIRTWIESGAQKVGEFQREVGISSVSYGSFMKRQGTWDGEGCDLYWQAALFFRKRELQGLPLAVPKAKAKKAKTDNVAATAGASTKKPDELLDVFGIELHGEEEMNVPVYDTCNEMRKHIRALQAKPGVTQAAICRAFSTSYPEGSGKSVSPANLRTFMNNKGYLGGNTSSAFYGGYVFFEKRRLKLNKPKSKFREEMEMAHSFGVDVKINSNAPVFCSADRIPAIDKYGVRHSIPSRR